MPTSAQIIDIKAAFARQYDLDLDGIERDAKNFRLLVADTSADTGVNSGQITSNCYTYDGTQAIVPNLETTAFSEIPSDARVNARRVELTLDEAIKYSQTCLQIRHQYGEAAKLRNDTRFKGEEFVRLDDVHKDEVAAHLYKIPWQDAADERTGLETAKAQADVQQSIPEEMLREGVADKDKRFSILLSKGKIDTYVDDSSFITVNVARPDNENEVRPKAAETAKYRCGLDLATWLETFAATKANVAQLNAKLSIVNRKEEYLRKDEVFRTQRAEISRQIAWLQIGEHCREDSELNYNRKLRQLKTLFDANIRCLIERVGPLAQGLKEYYNIDLPLAAPRTGDILDNVSVWVVQVQNEFSKYKRAQRLSIFSKWNLGSVNTSQINSNGLTKLQAEFVVDKSDGPNEKALLRGVGFEYVGQNQLPVTLKVFPPPNASPGDSGSRPLILGRIYPIAPNLDMKPQHADALWNGSAIGTWKVEGEFDLHAGTIDRIIMHLWAASV